MTILFIAVFFFAMIAHELALEATSSDFSELDSLTAAVTLYQFGFCFLLPFILSRGKVCESFPKSSKEIQSYIKLSLLVFGATGLATQSLQFVNYPTKVIFKSAKLIPTMAISTVFHGFHGPKYTPLDYAAALLICLGAAGFSYQNGGGSDKESSYYGVALLTISIICDAVVPHVQKQLMAKPLLPSSSPHHVGLSAQAVMINTNAVGFGILLIYMIISGSFFDAVMSALTHPRLFTYLTCVGLCLSSAVLAYTNLIKVTSPVMAVTVTTLRKVVTITLSYFLYPKPILSVHIISGLMVLTGVLISALCKKRP